MLRRFLYLDSGALGAYLSALEGGARSDISRRRMKSGAREGGLDLKVAKGTKGSGHEDEESETLTDTPHARFQRLLDQMNADPEGTEWIEVMDPDADLKAARLGSMIEVECEIYVPDTINVLAKSAELGTAIDMMDRLMPFADVFGLDMAGAPSDKERKAAKSFTEMGSIFGNKLLVVGDLDDTNWRIAGQLTTDFIDGDLEGRARIVGKVSAQWGHGQWKPIMALPGSSLLPRDQRRRMEKKGPEPGKEGDFLEGPAAMLDILAIYR